MIRFCLVFLLWAPLAVAQTDPALLAERARGQIAAAAAALAAAEGARDRVAALTRTVQAYETGLAAVRAGLRASDRRARRLTQDFEARRDEIAQLLGVLAALGQSPAPVSMLHPAGPLGTVRSGMVLGEIAPALQRQAAQIRAEIEELLLLQGLQASASKTLEEGLAGAQAARVALVQAIAAREDLPDRLAADPDAMERLARSADTLEAFTVGLGRLREEAPAAFSLGLPGDALPLPVDGTLLRGPDEADDTGVARPGLSLATFPAALVTAPVASSVLYAGALLNYGNVIILEPADDVLIVLGGLAEVFVYAGEVLEPGAPLGFMGGETPGTGEFLSRPDQGGGARRSETLYIEVRRGERAEDPSLWFAIEEN